MTITQEQVRDLREGDVVRLEWELGGIEGVTFTATGPLKSHGNGYLTVGGYSVRDAMGQPVNSGRGDGDRRLEVVSRAPLPFYANCKRSKPIQGDVVRIVDLRNPHNSYTNIYDPRGNRAWPWLALSGERWTDEQALPKADIAQHYRIELLVDGETGEVVP